MPPTIMIVEDDEELNDLLQYNLRRVGYQTLPIWDGGEAIAALERQRPDLVLLDLMLPGADGLEVCHFMTADEDLKQIPIIVFTARGSREDFDKARQYNVAGYFTKPYATPDVLRHVEKVLSSGLHG